MEETDKKKSTNYIIPLISYSGKSKTIKTLKTNKIFDSYDSHGLDVGKVNGQWNHVGILGGDANVLYLDFVTGCMTA